jgi:hypothetical protein
MADALTLRGIEEIENTADAFVEATKNKDTPVPEFAEMVIRHRDQTCSVYPKIATKLTFPSANVLMFVDHSEPEIKLVLLNLNMGGCVGDVLRIELRDLPPEEEEIDEDV